MHNLPKLGPEVNGALIRFARRMRSLDQMRRRQAVRRVGEILPVVLLWIAARIDRRRKQ